jgi:hypothetical protein
MSRSIQGCKTSDTREILENCRKTAGKPQLARTENRPQVHRQKGDVFAKLTLGRAAAASAGYSEQEAMQTVLKVAQAAPSVEKKCKAPPAPMDAAAAP